jgi:ketosteroid isomerase-like protein
VSGGNRRRGTGKCLIMRITQTRSCRLALLAAAIPFLIAAADSPQAAVDELLAADRAFSAASAKTDVVAGLSAMFADDVVMPVPSGQFAEGKAAATAALASNADNAKSRVEWTPVRGGISADLQHGFTLGYMVLHRPDGTDAPLKYLAYWVKKPAGWRVAAYKRSRASAAPPASQALDPALPARAVPPSTDSAAIARYKTTLDEAERAFSRDARRIGLGAAFAQYGSADAIHLGPPTEAGLVVGVDAVARGVAGQDPLNKPATISWGPDKSIVASSGDLGVTLGLIRPDSPAAGQPAAFPFFTIWRRPTTDAPWRYIAE